MFHQKRVFYGAMLQWAHRYRYDICLIIISNCIIRVAKMKRVSLCMRIATRHLVIRSAQKALKMWYRNTCEVGIVIKYVTSLMRRRRVNTYNNGERSCAVPLIAGVYIFPWSDVSAC